MTLMPLYRYTSEGLQPVTRTSLATEQIRERQDLQRVLRDHIEVLGDLLVIAEEYGSFQDSRRRIDLLAVDRSGMLVVIELKRTEDGGHMELQALRYAAMVSTMTAEHLVDVYARDKGIEAQEARLALDGFLDEPLEELPDQVRVVLVSSDFSTEITGTVIWLNTTYNTDISCFRIVPYKLGSEILFDLQQIIPLPEARDFQIQQRQKGAAASAARVKQSGKDFTRYDLVIGGREYLGMSKQGAVKLAIKELHHAGVDLALIREATQPRRWVAVRREPALTVTQAFSRQFPGRSPSGLWYDLDINDGDIDWVIPRFGGRETEQMLDALARIAPPKTTIQWSATDLGADESDAE